MMKRKDLEDMLANFERQRDHGMAQINQAHGAIIATKAMLAKLAKLDADEGEAGDKDAGTNDGANDQGAALNS